MNTTGGTRVTICSTAVTGVAGLAITSLGLLHDQLPPTIGGSCLALIAAAVGALLLIRRWIIDTTDIRTAFAASQRETERERSRYIAERSRYIALQAALESEQGRLNRDMAAARQQMARDLTTERKAMRTAFEEQRADLMAETMEAAFLMFHNGKFAPDASTSGRLIRFPQQGQPTAAPHHERSREHGIVGP